MQLFNSIAHEAAFKRAGEFWTITFDGQTVYLRDTAGLRHLALLLANAGAQLAALQVARLSRGEQQDFPVDRGDREPALDGRAAAEYRSRLAELRDELEEAENNCDVGRCGLLKDEIAAIERELSAAFGLSGRARRGGTVERARQRVSIAMKRALARIDEEHPPLAQHLRRALRTGTFCSYDPDPLASIRWAL